MTRFAKVLLEYVDEARNYFAQVADVCGHARVAGKRSVAICGREH